MQRTPSVPRCGISGQVSWNACVATVTSPTGAVGKTVDGSPGRKVTKWLFASRTPKYGS